MGWFRFIRHVVSPNGQLPVKLLACEIACLSLEGVSQKARVLPANVTAAEIKEQLLTNVVAAKRKIFVYVANTGKKIEGFKLVLMRPNVYSK